MPRRSKVERFTPIYPAPQRTSVRPPPTLSEPARLVFEQLASSVDKDHFVITDVPLLAQYAEAIVLAEHSAAELQVSPNPQALALWEKSIRAMTALSMRLRLSPQARREKARAVPQPRPWTDDFIAERFKDDARRPWQDDADAN
jgi:phage terminase small subunit